MVTTNIRIDKLKTIIRFPSNGKNLFPDPGSRVGMTLGAIMEHVHACTSELKPGAQWWRSGKGAMTFSQYPLNGLGKLIVTYGWSPKGKNAFATFQFNPSHLCQAGTTELDAQFSQMFNFGYAEFFDTAVTKEVEIALDAHGVQKESCLFLDRKVRTYNPQYEAKGTTYLGGEHSKYGLSIYDKRKQIVDTGGVAPSAPWLRIEATLRNSKMKLCDLSSMPWPFETLVVIDVQKLAAAEGSPALDLFKQRVLHGGLHPQLAYSVSDAKVELLQALNQTVPDWYQPDTIWKQFPNVATFLEPEAMQLIASSPHFTTPVLQSMGHLSPLVGA